MPDKSVNERQREAEVLLDSEELAHLLADWQARVRPLMSAKGPWALVGIKRRGAVIARRLWEDLRTDIPELEFGEIDISLYRDDYHLHHSQPRVLGTEIAFQLDGCNILLVDDVLYTGRTVRAAIDLLLDFGRPKVILLAVLIDRGHRELPIAPNVTGVALETRRGDKVQVRLTELDGRDEVLVLRGGLDGAV